MTSRDDVFEDDVFLSQSEKSRADLEAMRIECQKSARQRTQEAADRLFDGPVRYRVSVPADKTQPVIDIKAHSAHEAEGRYRERCGIRADGTTNPIVAKEVGEEDAGPPPEQPGFRQFDQPLDRRSYVDPLQALHAEL